jgi:hypothetical protein
MMSGAGSEDASAQLNADKKPDIELDVVESALLAPSTSSELCEGDNDNSPVVSSSSRHHGNQRGSRRGNRDSRLRRKLRYQYVEEMVANKERAIMSLRHKLEMYKRLCSELDEGRIPTALANAVKSAMTDKLEK